VKALEVLRHKRVGIWTAVFDALPTAQVVELGSELDDLGYGSLWFGEAYGGESLTTATMLSSATGSIVIGTGIANIYARGAMATAAAARTIHALSGGRFVLGLGVSHQPLVERDRKMVYAAPVTAMGGYLDGLEQAPYFGANDQMPPIVLAALGPQMLALARDRAAGAHPYLVTPEHTHRARQILGHGPLLVVEQAVVLNEEHDEALRRAHEHLNIYTGLPNYRNNWLREGFSEDDFVRGGSDKLANTLVAIGDEGAVFRKVTEHLEAGADHVCLQVLGTTLAEAPIGAWRSLAAGLADLAS
jgi:probable F420-dependent oxidoreductase